MIQRQARDGGVAALHQLGVFRHGEESELAGRLARIEQQSQIGGRNARRLEESVFLHVVGDKVIVALAAKFEEEAPDAQRVFAQEQIVFAAQLLARFTRRPVEPGGDVALESPQKQDGRGGEQREGMEQRPEPER